MIEYRNEPFQYRLSAERCRGENPELLLLVSEAFATRIAKLDRKPPAVEHLMGELFDSNASFDGGVSEETSFGFNSALHIGSWENGMLPFHIPIPVVEYEGEGHCNACNGEGKHSHGDEMCFFCSGSGKESVIDYQKAFEVSATLTALSSFFAFLMDSEFEGTDVPPLQLLHFFTITIKDMHGGSLGGSYSEPLVSWLSRFPARSPLAHLSGAMKAVFYHAFPPKGERSLEDLYFHATVEDRGWLNITCPGDACGLNPKHGYLDENKGYGFVCHNVDNPVQQLTLLAALGALSDMAVEAGVGQ